MADKEQLENASKAWVQALAEWRTGSFSSALASVVTHNGNQQTPAQYAAQVMAYSREWRVEGIELDLLVVDTSQRATASRLIYRNDQGLEWPEYPLTFFDADWKISKIELLIDTQVRQAKIKDIGRTPMMKLSPGPPGFDSKMFYRGYIDAVNKRTIKQDLENFYHPIVTHNEQSSNLEEFREFFDNSFTKVQGLNFTITHLFADEGSQTVAARLQLRGKPVGEFLGVEPTGRDVSFPEHAIYKLSGGKITYMWAMRDVDTYRDSIGG